MWYVCAFMQTVRVCVCVRPLNVLISRISLPVWRARLFAYSGSLLHTHTHRDVIKVVYYAVDPEGRCVTRVVTPRKTLRPVLIKHSIVYILYVKKKKKTRLEQMERMPKEQLFYKANTLSRFSLKEKINLVLDISVVPRFIFSRLSRFRGQDLYC